MFHVAKMHMCVPYCYLHRSINIQASSIIVKDLCASSSDIPIVKHPSETSAMRCLIHVHKWQHVHKSARFKSAQTTTIQTHVLVTLPTTVPFASAALAQPLSRPQTANSTFASADKSREATPRSVSGWSGKNSIVAA
jgi:hypothetical protein